MENFAKKYQRQGTSKQLLQSNLNLKKASCYFLQNFH